MKKKLLFAALAALGFSACDKDHNEDLPVYYGPGPNWQAQNIDLPNQAVNEENQPINGIRVVTSYLNPKDSLITDTAYTRSYESIDGKKAEGVATSVLKIKDFPMKGKDPEAAKLTFEYTDVDGEESGSFEKKTLTHKEFPSSRTVTLFKKKKQE